MSSMSFFYLKFHYSFLQLLFKLVIKYIFKCLTLIGLDSNSNIPLFRISPQACQPSIKTTRFNHQQELSWRHLVSKMQQMLANLTNIQKWKIKRLKSTLYNNKTPIRVRRPLWLRSYPTIRKNTLIFGKILEMTLERKLRSIKVWVLHLGQRVGQQFQRVEQRLHWRTISCSKIDSQMSNTKISFLKMKKDRIMICRELQRFKTCSISISKMIHLRRIKMKTRLKRLKHTLAVHILSQMYHQWDLTCISRLNSQDNHLSFQSNSLKLMNFSNRTLNYKRDLSETLSRGNEIISKTQ